MYKPVIAGAFVALGALGWQPGPQEPPLILKEEALMIEYTPGKAEAVIRMEAESEEPLDRVDVRTPAGRSILKLRGAKAYSLSGFLVETREMNIGALLNHYEEGRYDMRAITASGRTALGGALLSHGLLPAPIIQYPLEGAVVPPKGLTVTWTTDPAAERYRVVLEQDENDGLVVELPRGTNSFTVPDGFLRPDTETQVEVGVIRANRN